MLMSMGIPYGSDTGRGICGALTALLNGQAFLTSSRIASYLGPFAGFRENEEPMLQVMEMHREATDDINGECPPYLKKAARECWDECVDSGRKHGYRNAQATVLAPTGTIAFMMDCDTTGIEPDIALVKYKQLAGGGMMKIVNRTVPLALESLGYTKQQAGEIVSYIDERETIEGAPHLKEEHLPVFDCAFTPANGSRSISWRDHVTMMAAAQPFLSGAISKTVNMPSNSTVEDVREAYLEGWKLGLKALAIYRDGSKQSQPLATSKEGDRKKKGEEQVVVSGPVRRRLPSTRQSVTHKFSVAGHDGYITVGCYEDGSPGELFITMAKEGSTIGGLMDTIGTLTSMALQYGVPLGDLVNKFSHMRFEPSGWTGNAEIPNAKSVVDYIFRWFGIQFLPGYREANTPQDLTAPAATPTATPAKVTATRVDSTDKLSDEVAHLIDDHLKKSNGAEKTGNGRALDVVESDTPAVRSQQFAEFQSDAPACDSCGAITVRNGNCYLCHNCGQSMGCS